MGWYRLSDRKASLVILPFGFAVLFISLAGCRSPSEKNVSDTFVSTCAVTPAILKANTCINFLKSAPSKCFLRLHGYSAPEQTLEAADSELMKLVGHASAYVKQGQKSKSVLAPQEGRSIDYYTSMGYLSMNRALRGDDQLFNTHKNTIYSAASGLNKLQKFEGTVFRTENVDISMLDSVEKTLKVGNIVVEEVFLSTTSRPDFVFSRPSRGLHISYKIQSKTGRDLKPVAADKFEAEVLFVPGSTFRVLSINKEVVEVLPRYGEVFPDPLYSTRLKIEMEEIDLAD